VDRILRNRQPGSSTLELYRLWTTYRADGAIAKVERAQTTDASPRSVSTIVLDHHRERRVMNDSVGRRIAASDPDTDSRSPERTSADRTWRYLYNRVGDLVAVRDPRGCGQNFYYDHARRLIAEQYVSCGEAQIAEEPVAVLEAGAVGLEETDVVEDVDVRHYFDAYAGSWAAVPSALDDYPSDAAGVVGRLTATVDRASRSVFAYDARGVLAWSASQLALLPDEVAISTSSIDELPAIETSDAQSSIVTFDEEHVYVVTHAFDHGGRERGVVLPREPDWDGSGAEPRVLGTMTYDRRGLPTAAQLGLADGGGAPVVTDGDIGLGSAALAIHPIIDAIAYEDVGLVASVLLPGGTLSQRTYDAVRRPTRVWTVRAPTAAPGPDRPLGAVTTGHDQSFAWDAANNLAAVLDGRDPLEWPDGHRPQSMFAVHDALYRVAGVEYEYTLDGGARSPIDASSDWRDAHRSAAAVDPMRPEAAPMIATMPAGRPVSITWEHDWLGNVFEWTDDAHQFYERSLGDLVNGADAGPALRPSALYLAADLDGPPSDRGGWLELDYGEGGNVVALTVHAQCSDASAACDDPGGADLDARRAALRAACSCQSEQHTQFRWDEANRLSEARRYDRSGTGDWVLRAREAHRYDAANVRRVHGSSAPDHPVRRVALSVVPNRFELSGLEVSEDRYAPAWTGELDAQYLVAGARVLRRTDAMGASELVLHMPITDLLGTTAAVVDLLTSELVEHGTYLPNGARETLRSAAEAPIEPRGFTGKEADVATDTIYFGERHLAPRLGRWLSPDPLEVHAMGAGEAMNSYHYVSGNLLQARDPIGLQPTDPDDILNEAANALAEAGELATEAETFLQREEAMDFDPETSSAVGEEGEDLARRVKASQERVAGAQQALDDLGYALSELNDPALDEYMERGADLNARIGPALNRLSRSGTVLTWAFTPISRRPMTRGPGVPDAADAEYRHPPRVSPDGARYVDATDPLDPLDTADDWEAPNPDAHPHGRPRGRIGCGTVAGGALAAGCAALDVAEAVTAGDTLGSGGDVGLNFLTSYGGGVLGWKALAACGSWLTPVGCGAVLLFGNALIPADE
jgi:RHS repeat-associated protein